MQLTDTNKTLISKLIILLSSLKLLNFYVLEIAANDIKNI